MAARQSLPWPSSKAAGCPQVVSRPGSSPPRAPVPRFPHNHLSWWYESRRQRLTFLGDVHAKHGHPEAPCAVLAALGQLDMASAGLLQKMRRK